MKLAYSVSGNSMSLCLAEDVPIHDVSISTIQVQQHYNNSCAEASCRLQREQEGERTEGAPTKRSERFSRLLLSGVW